MDEISGVKDDDVSAASHETRRRLPITILPPNTWVHDQLHPCSSRNGVGYLRLFEDKLGLLFDYIILLP